MDGLEMPTTVSVHASAAEAALVLGAPGTMAQRAHDAPPAADYLSSLQSSLCSTRPQ
jgi:hypothetical protein